ncbi:MAG: SDR family oxidoreductase [Rhodobacteraceae bacterium]|nr:SDR family oxidoreductase [Paracoccaceae bacterium]
MDLELSGKVALVTAASRGLGRAAAEALAGEGVQVVATARGRDALEELGAAHGGAIVTEVGDVTDPAFPDKLVQGVLQRFGRLDFLIANTPGPPTLRPFEAEEKDFAEAFDTVFHPVVRLIRSSRQALGQGGNGRILVVSSTSARAPKPFLSLSATARSALWAWCKSAAPELFDDGVTLNALFAGPHATERLAQVPSSPKAVGRPEDFGRQIAMMCSPSWRFTTGTGVIVDGGETRSL